MALRGLVCFVTWAPLACFGLAPRAQYAATPTAYTVTAYHSIGGRGTITKTYRLGSKALVDQSSTVAEVSGSHVIHMRTLYDLEKKEGLTWDVVDTSAPCVEETFTEDWGDPFAGAADLAKQGARQAGSETIHGFVANVLETPAGAEGTMKTWVDTRTGMVVKAEMIPRGGAPQTMVEVTDVSLAPPPASLFAVPASCGPVVVVTQATAVARSPNDAEELAALTGGDAKNYVNGMYGPGSTNSCTMLFRVVRAGSLEAMNNGFQVAVDLDLATEPTPNYTIGTRPDGQATFSGGGLHEINARDPNGGFRVDNIPPEFEIDIEFGSTGSASARLYRQCFAPQTVLLYVVKDPANIAEGGGWLWVKTGKYATVSR